MACAQALSRMMIRLVRFCDFFYVSVINLFICIFISRFDGPGLSYRKILSSKKLPKRLLTEIPFD
jgi:hypothetical protein